MKKKLLLVVLTAGLLTGCSKTIPTLSNGDQAMIEFADGSKISVDDVWKDVKDSYALNVVMEKMDMKILKEEYKKKLKDMEKYVEGLETSIKSSYVDEDGKYNEEELLQTLSYYGYSSLEDYLDAQRVSYLQELATTDYAKKSITDKEIKNYYDKEVVGDISCLHILVKPASSSKEDLEKAEKKAKDIIEAIKKDVKAGTKPVDAFNKYKDNKDITFQDLGYFNKGDMVSEFETAAYALKVGSYSTTPVKTSYGYHVIYKVDAKKKDTLENKTEDIKEKIAQNKIKADSTLAVNAMIELRKSYGVKFYDDDIESQYNKYVNYLLNKDKNTNKNKN